MNKLETFIVAFPDDFGINPPDYRSREELIDKSFKHELVIGTIPHNLLNLYSITNEKYNYSWDVVDKIMNGLFFMYFDKYGYLNYNDSKNNFYFSMTKSEKFYVQYEQININVFTIKYGDKFLNYNSEYSLSLSNKMLLFEIIDSRLYCIDNNVKYPMAYGNNKLYFGNSGYKGLEIQFVKNSA